MARPKGPNSKPNLPSVEAVLLAQHPDQRKLIRNALEQGRSIRAAAQILGVSEKMIYVRCKEDPTLLEGIDRNRGRRPLYSDESPTRS